MIDGSSVEDARDILMIMLEKYKGKLYCFSPPVMLATFIFEFGAALYVLWRYKLNEVGRLVTALLIALGTFQLAEYMICGGLGMNTADWSRLGYVSITILPALGIHLATALAGKRSPKLLMAAYGMAILFMVFFALVPGAINIRECRPNYAVFNVEYIQVKIYTYQYLVWLLVGIILAWRWAKEVPNQAKALYALIAGYLVFMIPTAAITLVDRPAISGIPSIMCGFAVLLAIILVMFVLPYAGESRSHTTKHKER